MKDFLNGRRRRATHPGEVLRTDIMTGAGINQAQLAKALGVSRLTISEIVLEKRGVTPDIAIRLTKYFGTSPDLWLGLQKKTWTCVMPYKQTAKSTLVSSH